MFEVFPEGEQGVPKIHHFTMDPMDVLASINKSREAFFLSSRDARLKINGQLLMADSPYGEAHQSGGGREGSWPRPDRRSGLGMILRTILRKPEVAHITVLDKYPEVIDLVLRSPAAEKRFLVNGLMESGHGHVAGTRLELIAADVFQWEPPASTPKVPNNLFRHLV